MDTQNVLSGAGRDPVAGSRAGKDVQDGHARSTDSVRVDSGEAEQARAGESIDVARAQDVYARTEQATSPSDAKIIETPEEAGLLTRKLADQVREDGATALAAQASGVSAHLVRSLDHKQGG